MYLSHNRCIGEKKLILIIKNTHNLSPYDSKDYFFLILIDELEDHYIVLKKSPDWSPNFREMTILSDR